MTRVQRVVCLDPGHGGKDTGAIGMNGSREKDINFEVAREIQKNLNNERLKVVMTRTSDLDVALNVRAIISNKNDADLFISIHCNSSRDKSVHGVETLYFKDSEESKKLAVTIQDNLVRSGGLKNRGIKPRSDLAVLRLTNSAAVLVELAFISNPDEERLLNSVSFQRRSALAIASGVLKHLGFVDSVSPPGDWRQRAQKWVVENGISDGSRPDEPATREEVWEMLRRMYNNTAGR